MTDTTDSNDRKLGGAGGQGRTLSMRRPVEQSRVKQNFSHGRTKTVVVETRRKRPGGPGKEDERPAAETAAKPQFQAQPRVATPQTAKAKPRPGVKRELKVPAPTRTKADAEKRRGKLTLANALDENDDRARSIAAFRRRTERQKKQAQGFQMPTEKMVREVTIPEAIT